MKDNKQDWEKEFDEKFNDISRSKSCIYINSLEREREFQDIIKFCKSFISQKLKEQRERIIEEIEKEFETTIEQTEYGPLKNGLFCMSKEAIINKLKQ